MAGITLLLGRTRWRRRRALPVEYLSGVDPFGRPTFLYVTDTRRKQATVEREFQAFRKDRPTFAPAVAVLSPLLLDLARRHAGVAVLPERVVGSLAWRLLERWPERWPGLAAMGPGPALGEALATLHGQVGESGRRAEQVDGLPEEQVAFLRSLDTALAELPGGRVPRHVALRRVVRVLERPAGPLVAWLRRTHSVVVDDVLQASPLRLEALVALCRAWAAAGVHVVVGLESGRGLGGEEVERLFGLHPGDDEGPGAWSLRPFQATAGLRAALFEGLVATGEAEVAVAGLAGVESPEEGPEPPDVADVVYAGQPVAWSEGLEALAGPARFVELPDPTEELRWLAREVKRTLLDGASPEDCVVALADLPERAGLLRRVFADHGVPVRVSAGRRLAHHPVARLAVAALELATREPGSDEVLRWLADDLVTAPAGLDAEAVARWCRAAGVRRGEPSSWRARLLRWREGLSEASRSPLPVEASLEALAPAWDRLRSLGAPGLPREHERRLREVLEAFGLPASLDDAGLAGWGALLQLLGELARDLEAADPTPWTVLDWHRAVMAALAEAAFQDAVEPAVGAVQVVGVLELRGLTPRHTWLGGLLRGAFPRPSPSSFLVPWRAQRALQADDPGAEARYLALSLLRNARWDREMRTLCLSWPATNDGRQVARSPVVEDLLGVTLLHPDGRRWRVADAVERPRWEPVQEPLAASDRLRLAALESTRLAGLPGTMGVRGRRGVEVVRARQAPTLTPWDGVLDPPPPRPLRLGVSRLEGYLRCPATALYRHVLGLAEDDAWTPELEAPERGAALHEVLERFLLARSLAPLHGDEDPATSAALHAVASAVLDGVEAAGSLDPAEVLAVREAWLAGLVDGRPSGLLAAWLAWERGTEPPLAPLAVEADTGTLDLGDVVLWGRVDRVDRLEGVGLVVTDYKTGLPPSRRATLRGLALQPVAYAEALARQHPGTPVAFSYLTLRQAESVGRTGWVGEPEVLASAVRAAPQGARVSVVEVTGEDRARLLDHAAEGARRMGRGIFHPSVATASEAGCDHCTYWRICRVDRARSLAGDVQRPLDTDAGEEEAS